MREITFAKRMDVLGTESAFEVLARAKALEAQGKDITHLEIGEPDFDTPAHITEAAIKALQGGQTHYTPAAGTLELRETIVSHVKRTREAAEDVTVDNVVVTPGAKPILFFSMLALLNEGDEVIYPNPGFPIYESVIRFCGAKPVPVPLREENAFRFSVDELRSLVTEKTRMIIINSPQNPTGGVLTREDLEAVADVAKTNNIMIISDEIYSGILYTGNHVSMLSIPGMLDYTILLDGFSKTYAMTGWRLGYGVMPKALAQKVTQLMINCNSCTAAFTQSAGVAALAGSQEAVLAFVEEFKARRDVIVEGVNKIPGFRCLTPNGAFYVFVNISGTGMNSKDLQEYLLNTAGVAVLDGACFGEFGSGYIRLSYATSIENIKKALSKIEAAMNARKVAST